MTIDLNRLNDLDQKQLLQLAKETNAPHHHKHTKEKLIESITNKVFETTANKPVKTEAQEPKQTIFLTEAELEAAFAPIKAARPAFSTVYDHENNCVTMRYNDGRYKHAETMNLSCPLTKFKRKAAEIAKGPLLMPTHRTEDWERLGSSQGKNAYTAVVLG